MNQFIIQEDYMKCSLYLIINGLLSILFFLLTVISLTYQKYLITFVGITTLWFTIKYMIRYGKILIKKYPICIFDSNGIQINYDHQFFKYKDIIDVKIIQKKFSIKLFIKSLDVEHPSKYYYINIAYLIKQKKLSEIEQTIINILKEKKVKII